MSQGPINVHQREYLGTTDEGVAMLRAKLRRDIRAIADQGLFITLQHYGYQLVGQAVTSFDEVERISGSD